MKNDGAGADALLHRELDELAAVKARHVRVDEHEIRLLPRHRRPEPERRVERHDLVAASLEQELCEITTDIAVVHHQDPSLGSAHRRAFQ